MCEAIIEPLKAYGGKDAVMAERVSVYDTVVLA
jgi:hypothetical protein